MRPRPLSVRGERGFPRRALLFAVLWLAPAIALAAHGASPLKVVEETRIEAEPKKVWAVLADFQNWGWLPELDRFEGGNGAVPDQAWRKLTFKNGAVFEESLTKLDAERMSLDYHVDQVDLSTLPATNYTAIVTVRAGDDGRAIVEWKARFYRGHPQNDPPPELNDDVALDAVTKLHKANLAALKAKVEGK